MHEEDMGRGIFELPSEDLIRNGAWHAVDQQSCYRLTRDRYDAARDLLRNDKWKVLSRSEARLLVDLDMPRGQHIVLVKCVVYLETASQLDVYQIDNLKLWVRFTYIHPTFPCSLVDGYVLIDSPFCPDQVFFDCSMAM
jgi:hypothetical protein